MQFSPAILTPFLTAFALLGALCLPAPQAHAQGRDSSWADDSIQEMAQAYKARDRKRMAQLLPQLRGYVLEPWAAYWELSARLDDASTTEIQNFLSRYSGSYQEDRLRNEWLLLLGRKRDWTTFQREHAKFRMNDDRSVSCYAALADHLANGTDIRETVRATWLGLKDADEACASAADQMLEKDPGDKQFVWLRARLGMETDRLRITTQAMGLLNPAWNKTVNAIYLNPGKYLNDKLTALRPQTREMVSLALIRQAYIDPSDAAEEIDKLRWKAQLTPEERGWIWGVIGKRAAQKLDGDALRYFGKGQLQYMHDDHKAWYARAALRAGQWPLVQQVIAAMGDAQRADVTWAYWGAKAELVLAKTDAQRLQARAALEKIAGVRGFYEQLASEDLGLPITTPAKPLAVTPEERMAARQDPGLTRALYAIQIGLRADGVREWNYTTNLHQRGGMDDRALLAAAELACSKEVWDRCINTSERTRSFIDQDTRYPMPFKDAVVARARQIGLDPAYVYGLIRQESRFIMDARSHVGASGLMQVMPATARWTAKKIGMDNFQAKQINDRDTNIAIGTGYLKLVLDNFGGSMPLAAAAYNAGPNRPKVWRGQSGAATIDAAIWAENVPFPETRDYVKKVLANTTNYAALISGQPQSLRARLGTVGPASAAAVDNAELP